jgi:UPF0271 protein
VKAIDLVADVGESFGAYRHGDDERLIPLLSSANVACGFHAGDPRIMQRTVKRCVDAGVSIGAHPGFADLIGFGRRDIDCSENDVYTDTVYQLGALRAIAAAQGAKVAHLSPHGRLGNLVQSRSDLARAVAKAARAVDPELVVLGLPGALDAEAGVLGLATATIGFVDRAYLPDGSLLPRAQPGAVLEDPGEIADRAVRLATEGHIRTVAGTELEIRADSLLLHGDNPAAVAIATRVREALDHADVEVAPLPEILRARATAAAS